MEINIIEETKDRLKFEIVGEDHTLCNLLRDELWKDKHLEVAGYNVDHPLVSQPIMIVETDGSETPKKALLEAVERIKQKNKEVIGEFKSLK